MPRPHAPVTILPASAPTPDPVQPAPAGAARLRRRHFGILLSFALMVLLPCLVTAGYLWGVATDQYASRVGFSVRTEEMSSPIELLGGITELSGSSTSDSDILYEFIQSQQLVTDIDARLNLREIWSRPDFDPVFAYDADGSIEDLVDYWGRMVRIFYDTGTRLIEVRVQAFRPEDATAIAEEIRTESSAMINALSDAAREDAIRYARADLEEALDRLKLARQQVTEFRNRTQIVDPEADIQTQVGLLGTLQAQLAEALIEQDLLAETTRSGDPRIEQGARRIAVIEARIMAERRKLGLGAGTEDGEAFATLIGDYERLVVDREFAEQSYAAARAAYDSAVAEARRQSRYLAAHILPTRAETARYPQRVVLLGLVTLFAVLAWALAVLVFYALRDRR